MRTQEMLKMRDEGATYQEIADASGMSRQAVCERIANYRKRADGYRGKAFYVHTIKYKVIREHFANNAYESISSFAKKVGVYPPTMRNFLTGKTDSYFTIAQVKRMCEVVGGSFEEVFGVEMDGKGEDE